MHSNESPFVLDVTPTAERREELEALGMLEEEFGLEAEEVGDGVYRLYRK